MPKANYTRVLMDQLSILGCCSIKLCSGMTSIKARSRIRNAARHLGYERLGIRVHTQQTVVADRTFILGYVEPEDWQKWQNSEV